MERQIVVFQLGSEGFGIEIAFVESIIKMQTITQMPHAPAFVEGLINLRGKILPVIDLRKRFGLQPKTADKKSRIIVVSTAGIEVGMIVDAVMEVLTIADASIDQAPPIATTVDSEFITGIAKQASRLIILLDLDQVLADQAHTVLTEVAG
jgi:purine-binding chemotaxis protein CheW